MFTTKNIGANANIKIADIFGKNVYETTVPNPLGFVHQLDINQLSNGIYFVTVFNSNFKKTEKIILYR